MDNGRQSDREKRRVNKTALNVPDPYRPNRPPTRPVEPCQAPEEVPAQAFFTPEGCPVVPPAPDAIPDPLIFENEELTLHCADIENGPPDGSPVTIPAGTYTERVFFQNIANITTAQLTFIAGQSAAVMSLVKDPLTSTEDVRQLLQLEMAQAIELVSSRTAVIALLAAKTLTAAQNSLDCVWHNEEISIACAAGAFTAAPAGQESRVRNPVVIAAGTYSSPVSQADANARATTAATAALRCLWGNTEQVADCVTDLGFAEDVPVDETLEGVASRLRVGSVVVPANSFFSDISLADANNLAKTAAVGSLVCFYINAAQAATCPPDENGVAATIEPAPSGGSASTHAQGNPMTVPAGFIESALSTADANGQAITLAQSLLNCYWVNDEQTATCPNREYNGEEYEPSGTSPVLTVTIPAGEVVSFVSKAAANSEALVRAQLGLDCLYCNKQVDPKCPPADFTINVLPIPLSEIDDSWSLSATLGAPAGLFCTADPAEAQSVAESLGGVPVPVVTPPEDCSYGNDPVVASCVGDPELGVVIVQPPVNPVLRGGPCVGGASGTDTTAHILPLYLPESGTIYVSLFEPAEGAQLSSQSYPNPFHADPNKQTLTLARNTVIVQEEFVPATYAPGNAQRAKLYANELAATMALSSLNCFFSNCAGKYRCHGPIANNEYDPPFIDYDLDGVALYGSGNMESPMDGLSYAVSAGSAGHPSTPVQVAEGQFTSYVSQLEVDTAVTTYLLSALNCFWTHPAVAMLCGSTLQTDEDGYSFTLNVGTGSIAGSVVDAESIGHPSNPVRLGAGFFRSDLHPNIPYIQAYALAVSQLDCFFRNSTATASCGGEGIPSEGAIVEVEVAAGMFSSRFSQENADALAATAASSGLFCMFDSEEVSSQGCGGGLISTGQATLGQGAIQSPAGTAAATAIAQEIVNGQEGCLDPDDLGGTGQPGAQTDCDGNCYGYFS